MGRLISRRRIASDMGCQSARPAGRRADLVHTPRPPGGPVGGCRAAAPQTPVPRAQPGCHPVFIGGPFKPKAPGRCPSSRAGQISAHGFPVHEVQGRTTAKRRPAVPEVSLIRAKPRGSSSRKLRHEDRRAAGEGTHSPQNAGSPLSVWNDVIVGRNAEQVWTFLLIGTI